jgi:hypothetical protein
MWGPQPLATLRASTACTGIALPYPTPSEEAIGENNENISSVLSAYWLRCLGSEHLPMSEVTAIHQRTRRLNERNSAILMRGRNASSCFSSWIIRSSCSFRFFLCYRNIHADLQSSANNFCYYSVTNCFPVPYTMGYRVKSLRKIYSLQC